MGEFSGINIVKLNGGTGRRTANTDGIMALVVYTPVMPTDVAANTALQTIQALDAKNAGIDDAFDANNKILFKHHIDQFYRLAPNGELWVIPTDKQTAKAFFESDEAKALFRTVEDIKRIGFVANNDEVVVLNDEINAAQVFINDLNADDILIDGIYLEGRNIGKAPDDNRELDCPNVSVIAFQDKKIATIESEYNKYAAVGVVMGSRAVRKVNEDLGSTDIVSKPDYAKGQLTYPISNSTTDEYTTVALSDGTLTSTLTQAEKDAITEKAYIYAASYRGFAGVYLNTEPTCVDIISDYAFGNNNGVWNKAARNIRQALLPKVKSVLKREASTGNLTGTTVASLEILAEKPIKQMIADDEISGGDIFISADQTPSDQVPLKIKGSITKDTIVFNFEFELGLN